MAMNQPDTGIVRLESNYSVAVRIYSVCVALHGNRREVSALSCVPASTARGSFDHLELVAMQMEGVDRPIQIVDCYLNNFALRHHKWVDCAIDDGICVGSARTDGGE